MSAQIIRLADYRDDEALLDCDAETALDVAHRDLAEILQNWGTDMARVRAEECLQMISSVLGHGAP